MQLKRPGENAPFNCRKFEEIAVQRGSMKPVVEQSRRRPRIDLAGAGVLLKLSNRVFDPAQFHFVGGRNIHG